MTECLFENPENQPKELREILRKHAIEYGDDFLYSGLNELLTNVEKIGYTFDYGMGGAGYNLRSIERFN